MPDKQPNGEAWEIRTYASLRELVPLLEPERDGSYVGRGEEDIVLRPFPLIFKPRIEVPSRDDWPFQRYDVYDRHSDALDEFRGMA